MAVIQNPVLPGFNPDPAMICVDGVFYVANSTFEYYPGVKISKSTNLKDWEIVSYPLDRTTLLEMANQDASSGVWAPCLSYNQGRYYLVYSNVRTFKLEGKEGIPFHDDYNYLTTATDLSGPWSDPIFLGNGGFDSSLFHDDNGRKWYLYAKWTWIKEGGQETDHSAGFFGIALQEYSETQQCLIGEEKIIFKGTQKGLVEGPHLYKKNGYYYLLTAEGGTELEHACTIARSKSIFGPYETRRDNPYLVTSDKNDEAMLQKAGHGSMFADAKGNWYLAHLCGRPLKKNASEPLSKENGFSILGRETAVQPLEWCDDWPYILGGGNRPLSQFEAPYEFEKKDISLIKEEFNEARLNLNFQNLRTKMDVTFYNTTERESHLRIYGKDSIVSRYHQAAVFRRQEWFGFKLTTRIDFAPTNFQQLGGLVYRYNESNQYFLYLSYDELEKKRFISLFAFDQGNFINSLAPRIYLNSDGPIELGMEVKGDEVQFCYSLDKTNWHNVGDIQSTLILSDEYCWPGFTGAMIGLAVQDSTNQDIFADFDHMTIKPTN